MFVFKCFFFIILFYGICTFSMLIDGGFLKIKNLYSIFSFLSKVALKIIIFLTLLFIIYWSRQDHFVYFWDYAGYWSSSISRMSYMENNSFIDIITSLIQSINNDDYNIFLPTIIALPLKFFGYSFPKYVFITCIMFLIPTVLIQGMIALELIQNSKIKQDKIFIITVLLAVCFSGNYYAVFRGYIDIACLLPISIVMFLFIDYDFRRISISRNIAIALMLVLVWISRRYTIYFIIGYVIALLTKALFVIINQKDLRIIKKIIINFSLIGGISVGILLILFREFLLHALFTNYRHMYIAYDAPLAFKIRSLIASFGYISGIIIIIIGILCFLNKRNIVNYISLIIMGITETFLFWKAQDMGVHHRMLLNLPIFLIYIMCLDYWCTDNTECRISKFKKCANQFTVLFCVAMIFINFSKAFIPNTSVAGTNAIFSEKYYPLKRFDIDNLNLLADKLNNLTAGSDDHIYIAASGTTLNCDILRKLRMPYSDNAIPNMFNTCDVDLRDGFPTDFLRAKYIVTTDPIQLHLKTGQEVVRYLATNVQNRNSYIGCHFEEIDAVNLDNGIIAKIYMKFTDFCEEDLQCLKNYYTKLYPNNIEIFADRIF